VLFTFCSCCLAVAVNVGVRIWSKTLRLFVNPMHIHWKGWVGVGLHKKIRIAVYSLFSTLLVLKLERVLLMKMLLFSAQRQEEKEEEKIAEDSILY